MTSRELNLSHYVEKGDFAEVARLLTIEPHRVDERFSDDETPLHTAVLAASDEMVKLLLRYAPTHDAQDVLSDTPLHVACRLGLLSIVELLIQNGANTELKNRANQTPLEVARSVWSDENREVAAYISRTASRFGQQST